MKIKLLLLLLSLSCSIISSQRSYREDSVQIKINTLLQVNNSNKIEKIKILKIHCDYCNENQKEKIKLEAYYRTRETFLYDPKYRRKGIHKLALYMRISKKDFANLK